MTPEQERKLDRLLGFLDRFEAVFSPPAPDLPDPEELKKIQTDLEKAMAYEPNPADILFWSTTGPLPSELKQGEPEDADAKP